MLTHEFSMSGRDLEELTNVFRNMNSPASHYASVPPLNQMYPSSFSPTPDSHHNPMYSQVPSERSETAELIVSLMTRITQLESDVKSKTAEIERLKAAVPRGIGTSSGTSGDTQEESSTKTFRILLPFLSRLLLTNEKISSKPFLLAGIHWKVSLQKEGKNAIGCSVEICEPKALPECALYVGSFTITLISLDVNACRAFTINKPFTAQKSIWRLEKFISTEKLFDTKNEFVMCNSAMLKVEAVVYY